MTSQFDRVSLGATGIQISPMGIRTWAWGDTWFGQHKNVRQAIDNAGALGWRLADAEVAALDAASAGVGK